jgi:hypothetical protein
MVYQAMAGKAFYYRYDFPMRRRECALPPPRISGV